MIKQQAVAARPGFSEQQAEQALDLTALISSRICHDLAGVVGAINAGLEVLDDTPDPSMQAFAMDTIRVSARQAWARLEFARLAFGAAQYAGGQIDLNDAERIARAFVENETHKLDWQAAPHAVSTMRAKLLLNLVAFAADCLPRGGLTRVEISQPISQTDSTAPLKFRLSALGKNALPPRALQTVMQTRPAQLSDLPEPEPHIVQAFYMMQIADLEHMALQLHQDDAGIHLEATEIFDREG